MGTAKQKAKCGTQLTYDSSGGTGSYIAFSAALAHEPAMIIFDNQSDTTITISDDGVNPWKTFGAGDGLVLDCRANKGEPAKDLAFQIGTLFYANSAAGTGNFYISYVYAR